MPNYNFGSLSGIEFEELVRDLLQAHYGITLETFAPGKDGGVDVRWIDQSGSEALLVQCKQYEGSGYAALYRVLEKEAKRVLKRAPGRYLIATSVALTPGNKEDIRKLFTPVCRGPNDVLGREDINNLLGLHSEIELKHFKLWLTSTAVLERAVNAGVFGAAAATLERARRRAERYVHNPSFERALQILEERRICIVAGIPGIGKTTLAEVILAHYVARHEFQGFRVTNDISELAAIRRPNDRQIFYYDDFLGTTGVDLGKNEDRRLIELMDEVASKPGWRLLLTTREYILEEARWKYEAIGHAPLDLLKCVIRLEDYTEAVRARILYNHLFFSDIPIELKLQLLVKRGYRRIYGHTNYNPRIIEHMTSALHVQGVKPDHYLSEFLANLNNPSRIWRHAFESALSIPARNLLLVRSTLPQRIRIDELRAAFVAFHQLRRARYGFAADSNDFLHALKALDGNFVRTERSRRETHVLFHNPSVQDFLESHLRVSLDDVHDLMNAAVFFEQLQGLWQGNRGLAAFLDTDVKHKPLTGILEHKADFAAALERVFLAPSCSLSAVTDSGGRVSHWVIEQPPIERRALQTLQIGSELGPSTQRAIDYAIRELATRIGARQIARYGLLQVLRVAMSTQSQYRHKLFQEAHQFVTTDVGSIEDCEVFVGFAKEYEAAVAAEEIEAAKTAFLNCYESDVSAALDAGDPEDAGYVASLAEDLDTVSAFFLIDAEREVDQLRQHAAELEGPEPDYDEIRSIRSGNEPSRDESALDVDRDFERLADDLTN